MWIDENQGTTVHDRPFGYVGESGPGGGGWFWTHLDTLEKCLASIEPDAIDPPKRLGRRRVERVVREWWRKQPRDL